MWQVTCEASLGLLKRVKRRVDTVVLDAYAELEHDQHAKDHDHTLREKRQLERMAEPEQNAENVGDEQGEAHECAEAAGVPRPAYNSILGHVGHHTAKDHEPAGDIAHQERELRG